MKNIISCKRFFFLNLIFFSLFFSSCYNKNAENRLILDDKVYWTYGTLESSVDDIKSQEFNKLENFKSCNLMKLTKNKSEYVWLKITFSLPQNLKEKDLGFVIPSIHFADKVWLNDFFIGEHGSFPPNYFASQYQSQYCAISKKMLNQESENDIYIKVYVKGESHISSNIFISEKEDALVFSEIKTFLNSKVYMIFEGGMVCAYFVFFLLYIFGKRHKEYLYFALINVFTIPFITIFFISEVPFLRFSNISYFNFMKYFMCISCYLVVYFYSAFIINYLQIKESKRRLYVRTIILVIQVSLTMLVSTYEQLMRLYPVMLVLCVNQIVFITAKIVMSLFNEKNRHKAVTLLKIFSILFLTIIFDIVNHLVLKLSAMPYFTMFGWQTSIIGFILLMVMRHAKINKENEYLASNLQREVALKTADLEIANNELLKETKKSQKDLVMAASVQQKFLPKLSNNLKGWDISIYYRPLEEVSGDFYDFYIKKDELKGFSIFDVSGHGISAGLVTMLSKNIISNMFYDSVKSNDSAATIMMDINDVIIQEKGEIENYLTGLLFKINNSEIQFSNAGHPYPILYKASTGATEDLKHEDESNQYGAIGMNGISVNFLDINLKMEKGDVLVCFTDGLNESKDTYQNEFGRERIHKAIMVSPQEESSKILNNILNAQKIFSYNNLLEDDLTIMVLKKL